MLLWGVLRRHRHRRHVDGAGRHRRHALVRRAARPRARRAVGGQRHRAAGVPAAARRRRRDARLAGGGAGRRRRGASSSSSSCCCSCAIGPRTSACGRTASAPRDADARRPRPLAPLAALRPRRRARAAFWILAGTFFVCGASTNGLIGTHLIAACHDYGIPADALGAAARADGHLRHPRHDRLGLADRSLLEPPPAVRLLHAARAVAAVSAVHARRTAARASACSRCSTASTGSRPCRRRCGSPARRSAARTPASSTAGSAPATSSARRWPPSAPARSAPSPATTGSAFWIAGVLCVLAGDVVPHHRPAGADRGEAGPAA